MGESEPIPINELRTALPGSSTASREHFDEFTGLASADCTAAPTQAAYADDARETRAC